MDPFSRGCCVRHRHLTPEYVDAPDLDFGVLRASLAQVSQVNRWLGGDRGLRWALAPFVRPQRRLRVLDVGAGDGTTLDRLGRWAEKRRCRLEGVAVDAHRTACRVAAERLARPGAMETMEIVRADAFRLPFADNAFDAVVATLTLHHFHDEDAVRVLEEMIRVARQQVVVSDLERSWPAYLGARLLAATVWRNNPYTRHDGPISVQRGFKRGELEDLGRQVALEDLRVSVHLPFRLTLAGAPATGG